MTPTPPSSGDVATKVIDALDRIARGIRAHRQGVATRSGLTPLQAELLRTLAEGPPPDALTGRLAVELGVSQPTVSDSLVALERKGHVRRRPNAADRRRNQLTLTPSGAKLAAELRRADDVLRAGVAALPLEDQARSLSVALGLIGGLLDSGVLGAARTCPSCRFFRTEGEAARCELLQVPLAAEDLRVNCPEHESSRVG